MANKLLFFDSEFSTLRQDTTLISLGFITDDGKTFYAEFTDYDKDMANGDPWIVKNVLQNLYIQDDTLVDNTDPRRVMIKGDSKMIATYLKKWITGLSGENEKVEVWSDCLSYDWVLLCELLGGGANGNGLPSNLYYIPFDICTVFKLRGIDPDISREAYAEIDSDSAKHNALHDAKVIRTCYNKLMNMGQ